MSCQLNFAFINDAFKDSNKKSEEQPFDFDVIKSGKNTFGLVSINFTKNNSELSGFIWEVCSQTSGLAKPLKGAVYDTNVSSFVFPIKNTSLDYFVTSNTKI